MGFLCVPKTSRKVQRTLKNLRVSLLCFLLTFLMLRNTIGAGKFGTPAQDFEEIRQHLHYVGLHRRHIRVLAEAVVEEEEKQKEAPTLAIERRSSSPFLEEMQREALMLTPGKSALLGMEQRKAPLLTLERRSPLLEEEPRQRIAAPLPLNNDKKGNALTLRKGNTPSPPSRPLEGGPLAENAGFQKDLDYSSLTSWDEQRNSREALTHSSYGGSRVLLLTGLPSSPCKNPSGEHLLLKSLKNKVAYSTSHGLEISISFGGLDPQLSKVSLLERAFLKYPHVEWLWWLPGEALITDMVHKLLLPNYTDFNLVLLGDDDQAHRRLRLLNLNKDSFLIRNCQWSLDLLRANSKMGTSDQAGSVLTNSLFKGPRLEISDQSALIYLSKQEVGEFTDEVYVEQFAVLHSKWEDVAERFERIVKQHQSGKSGKGLPFITHFLGCNVCEKVGDIEAEMCAEQVKRALVFAEKHSILSEGFV